MKAVAETDQARYNYDRVFTKKGPPQGMTEEQFQRVSARLRDRLWQEAARTGDFGDDIFVHGSRGRGTAAPGADLDIGIRVSAGRFEQLLRERLASVKEGGDKWKTLQRALERGRSSRCAGATIEVDPMGPDLDGMDLFCRINVQAEMPFQEFVAFIARRAGGSGCMNAVRGQTLDISVFENDDFDTGKAHAGKDRWLYFRYTLEVDPVKGVAAEDYVASVGALLKSLWSSCMDAVAASDFEDLLPKNERRSKWAAA